MFSVVVLSLLIFIGIVEIHIIMPSLSIIQNEFGTNNSTTQLILSANLFFHGISAAFVGVLADKFGKKAILSIGMIILCVGSFVGFISNSFYVLMIGRILQGIGSAGPVVLAGLFIFDYFKTEEEQSKNFALFQGITSLSLGTGPIMGSYLGIEFGWRSVFLFIFSFSILILLCFLFIDKRNGHFMIKKEKSKVSIYNFLKILSTRNIYLYLMSMILGSAAYFTFVGSSAIVYLKYFKIDERLFGIYQSASSLSFGLSSLLSGFFIPRLGKRKMFIVSGFLISIFLVALFLVSIGVLNNPLIFSIAIICWSAGAVFPINIVNIRLINMVPEVSGKINSLSIVARWIISSIGSQLIACVYNGYFLSIGLIIFAIYLVYLIGYFILLKRDVDFRDTIFYSKMK